MTQPFKKRASSPSDISALWIGAGLGAGLMYFLDPIAGRRRRALVSDKAQSFVSHSGDLLDKAYRDLRQRGQGFVAEAKATLQPHEASDEVLEARVRSCLGRVVSHPRAIHVQSRAGTICLTGDVLAHEVDHLIASVGKVRGVKDVDNQLRSVAVPGDIPSLQGGRPRVQRMELLQENWSPGIRLVVGALGVGATAFGFARRSPVSLIAGMVGAGFFTRALMNLPFGRILDQGAAHRAIVPIETIAAGTAETEVSSPSAVAR
jgi:hypothetical protein